MCIHLYLFVDPTSYGVYPMISLVIPVKNEEAAIGAVLEDALQHDEIREIIVVDNASTDRTVEIASSFPVTIIRHSKDLGYMSSIQDGCLAASYDRILIMDGDGQYKIDSSIFRTNSDLVTGAKIGRKDSLLRVLLSRVMNMMVRLMFGLKLRDSNCGYKLIKRDLLWIVVSLEKLRYTPLTELCILAHRFGYDVKEVPVSHYPRRHGSSRIFTNVVKSALSTFYGLLKIWLEDKADLILGAIVSRVRNVRRTNYTRVLKYLYVGGKGHRSFPVEIDVRDIREGSYVEPETLSSYLKLLVEGLVNKRDVLVFCDKGRGRSVMVVCCYLITFLRMSWLEAYKLVKRIHPQAYLTREQFRSLRDYEKYIRGDRE